MDFYQMVFDMAMIIKNNDYGLYIIMRPRFNEVLVDLRDNLNVCDAVPEVDIKFKDQVELYILSENAGEKVEGIKGRLLSVMSENLDGSPS